MDPQRPRVHRVPGGYVVDDMPDTTQTLGCVFARDLAHAVERAERMLAALRGLTTEDTDAP